MGDYKSRAAVTLIVLSWLAAATPLLAQSDVTIGRVTARPGTTVSGEIQVSAPEITVAIPLTIVNGAKPGPVLALTAGVHGAEYPPILALQRIRRTVDPRQLSGTLVLVHVANMPSYLKRTIYYSPVDGKNLNRVFPGREDGTLSERIAYALTRNVIERADYVVDLHGGDANESLRPYSYWMTNGSPDVARRSKDLALAFGLDHIVIDRGRPTDPAASVYLSNTAITRGKPAITIESGALGMSDEESIARIERGIAGVMRHLKMRPDGPEPVAHPVWIGRSEVLTSPATGIFYWTVERGQTVAQGTMIGYVTDFFGATVAEIRAPFSGELLYVIGTPATSKGEPIAFIGERAKDEDVKQP